MKVVIIIRVIVVVRDRVVKVVIRFLASLSLKKTRGFDVNRFKFFTIFVYP